MGSVTPLSCSRFRISASAFYYGHDRQSAIDRPVVCNTVSVSACPVAGRTLCALAHLAFRQCSAALFFWRSGCLGLYLAVARRHLSRPRHSYLWYHRGHFGAGLGAGSIRRALDRKSVV